MEWPQIIMVTLMVIQFSVSVLKEGEQKGRYSLGLTIGDIAVMYIILLEGGFWR